MLISNKAEIVIRREPFSRFRYYLDGTNEFMSLLGTSTSHYAYPSTRQHRDRAFKYQENGFSAKIVLCFFKELRRKGEN